MPIMNSMGALKQQHSYGAQVKDVHWLNITNPRTNLNSASGLITGGGKLLQFGSGLISGSNYRSYVTNTALSGLTTSQFKFELNGVVRDVAIDSAGNRHIVLSPASTQTGVFTLVKLDSNNNLLMSKTVVYDNGGPYVASTVRTFGINIDSSNNVYVYSFTNLNLYETKINGSTYANMYVKQLALGVQVNFNFCKVSKERDSNGNVYVAALISSPVSSIGIFCLTQDTLSGGYYWCKQSTGTTQVSITGIVAHSNGAYIIADRLLLSLSKTGSITYAKDLSVPTGSGTSTTTYRGLTLTPANNFVTTIQSSTGMYVVEVDSAATTSSVTEIQINNNYDCTSIVNDGNYSYILSNYNDGVSANTPSIIKTPINGNLSITTTTFNFTETLDIPSSSVTWTGTISTNSRSAITFSSDPVTFSSLTPTMTQSSATISNISISSVSWTLYNSAVGLN